jgi:hypothetical protein
VYLTDCGCVDENVDSVSGFCKWLKENGDWVSEDSKFLDKTETVYLKEEVYWLLENGGNVWDGL